jgi:hypothetical protein
MKKIFLTFLLAVCFVTLAMADITTDLVGWYKFDDGSGSTAADSSGNSYNGTIAGTATWVTGAVNGALQFDGSTNQVALPSDANILGYTYWTIGFWIKNTNGAEHSAFGEGSSTGAGYAYVTTYQDNMGYTSNGLAQSTNDITNATWEHWVITGSGTTIAFYRNGVAEGTGSVLYGVTSMNRVTIGALVYVSSSGYARLTGSLDEVRLYRRVLSGSDITELYEYGEEASSAIKTVNGLAKASVKTINGLVIASVKSINGLL